MDFFERFTEKAKSAAGMASKKTEEAVEISKLNLKLSQLDSRLKKTYERIGTLVYEESQGYADNSDLTEICIREASIIQSDMKEVNARLQELKEKKICPSCGKENSQDKKYCEYCGTKL